MSLVGAVCPGTVDLECEGVDLTLLEWRYLLKTSSAKRQIMTFTSNEMEQNITLSTNGAFVFVKLTLVSQNSQNPALANFTSVLTVNITQLREQGVTEIQCGDTAGHNIARERIDVTVITENSLPTLAISRIHLKYLESGLQFMDVFWEKVSVHCESLVYYEVTLLGTGTDQSVNRITKQVSQDDCYDECSASLTMPEGIPLAGYKIELSATNSFGTTNAPPMVIERQSSQYVSLSIRFMDCVTLAQCFSVVGGNCTLQYTTTTDTGQLVLNKNDSLQLKPDTAYTLTATVVSDVLMVTEVMRLVTMPAIAKLSLTLEVQISIGVLLVILSLILLYATSRLICKLYQTSGSANQIWKTSSIISVILVVILVLVCVALWITVAIIVGPENDTCNSDWQQSRDAVIACSLMFSCLTSAVSGITMGLTCKAASAHRQNKQRDNKDNGAKGQVAKRNKLKSNGGEPLSYDHLDYNNPSEMTGDQQESSTSYSTTRKKQKKPVTGPLECYDETYPLETELQSPPMSNTVSSETSKQQDSCQYEIVDTLDLKVIKNSQNWESEESSQKDIGDQDLQQQITAITEDGVETDEYIADNYFYKKDLQWMVLAPSQAVDSETSSKEPYENYTVDNICYKKSHQWTAPELSLAAVSHLKKETCRNKYEDDIKHIDSHNEEES